MYIVYDFYLSLSRKEEKVPSMESDTDTKEEKS
jgi:hypothetical protein